MRILLLVVALVGCSNPVAEQKEINKTPAWGTWEQITFAGVDRFHDNERGVTCYRSGTSVLSCLPDQAIGFKAAK